MDKTYNIVEFAKLMNTSVKTLRRLDRGGFLIANRVLNNQYQYTEEHIGLYKEAKEQYLDDVSFKRHSYPADLTGVKFGKLRVIKLGEIHITPKGKHCKQWLCECECGNQVLAMDNSLRAGYKKSCGCLTHGGNETRQMRDEFNKLTETDAEEVLKTIAPTRISPKIERKSPTGVLQDLTGQRFGLWKVIERGETRYYKNGGQAVCWVCECECGTIKTVPGRDLKSGASQSCGCLSSISWLEFYTKQYLIDHNLEFEAQKNYSDLRGICGSLLYYDFLVLKNGKPFCLIECQGEQHYRPIKKFGGAKKLYKQIKNDEIKRQYAENVLHIPLYEILYTNMSKDDVYKALDEFFIDDKSK